MNNENKNTSADFAIMIAQMKANLPRLTEPAEVITQEWPIRAKALKGYYDALINTGFDKSQALEIVKAHGWLGK